MTLVSGDSTVIWTLGATDSGSALGTAVASAGAVVPNFPETF